MTTRREAETLIRTRMRQPSKLERATNILLQNRLEVPYFNKGAQRLYKVIIARTRWEGRGLTWKDANVEDGVCPSTIKSLAIAAHLSLERTERYYNQLEKENLLKTLTGAGKRKQDVCKATPSVLNSYPETTPKAKTHAQRQKEYRERKKLEALKAKTALTDKLAQAQQGPQ